MFITYTEYSPNTKKVMGYDGVTSFASSYAMVRTNRQLPDGTTETIILQEVVHLPGSFNLISWSQMMDKDDKVELVNHYGLNLHNLLGKLTATAPQVDGGFILEWVLDRAPEWTEYTNIDHDSCLLAFIKTAYASRHDAEKRMLSHHCLAHIGLKASEILLRVVGEAPIMTGKCDCES